MEDRRNQPSQPGVVVHPSKPGKMTDYAEQLLAKGPPRLFVCGACHIFALTLLRRFTWPLCLISEADGGDLHIACYEPDTKLLLDVFGWITYSEYKESRRGKTLEPMMVVDLEGLKKRLSVTPARGSLYFEPKFWISASRLANAWIDGHIDTFSGQLKERLNGRDDISDGISIFGSA